MKTFNFIWIIQNSTYLNILILVELSKNFNYLLKNFYFIWIRINKEVKGKEIEKNWKVLDNFKRMFLQYKWVNNKKYQQKVGKVIFNFSYEIVELSWS